MDVRLPDGTIIQNVPDGTTKADLVAKLQGNGMAVPAEWLQATPPAQPVQEAGQAVNRGLSEIPRQVGLTARYALEGPAQAAQVFTEPVAGLMRWAGVPTRPLSEIAASAADAIGLPKPESSLERVVGDASRLVAGGGGMLGAARGMAQLPGMVGTVGQGMAAQPAAQLSSAAGAGLMGGLSREGGGTEMQQAGAALLGGVAGGMVPGAAQAVARTGRNLLNRGMTAQQMDVQISSVLQRAGVDYAEVPERTRQALRAEMAGALRTGREINPDALRRLADFRSTGLTPTRGMLSQDPVQITREQNLAKIAASSADGELHGLPRIQNSNNAAMIRNLNEQGASRADAFGAGQRVVDTITAQDEALSAGVRGAYDRARGIAGGDIPLDRKPIIDGIYNELVRQNKMAFLPENIGRMLNDISAGVTRVGGQEFPVPFTPQVVDNLKTMMATASRGTHDGNTRAALSIARQVLEDAPFNVVRPPSTPGQLVTLADVGAGAAARGANEAAAPYMSALNEARGLARDRFAWQQSSRPVEQVLGGAQPDKLFQQHVLSGTVQDTRQFMRYAGEQQTRDAVLGYLRDKALNDASDEVGKFSSSAFNRALQRIGDQKLGAIFEPEQLAQLRALGRASSYAQAQPVGSAVNNSNSGALVLGKTLDAALSKNIPIWGPNVGTPVQSLLVDIRQRQAQNIMPSLLAPQEPRSVLRGLLTPSIAYSGGLLAPPDDGARR